MDKRRLLAEFSAEPDAHYRVELFGEEGFSRKGCPRCGRFFWSAGGEEGEMCPDDAAGAYSFIGDPPTPKRFDYARAWREVEGFFVENGHESVPRYPVVCRWRDDLHFTIASIVDFQRVTGAGIAFEFPANPLVVPQTCLRFKDLENVGVTGRHFSSFCMVGQHAVPGEGGGYWKDECIRLDYALLTGRFGIPGGDITFVEDVWAGGGSFGPSLEYFVGGLELGNAVFTEFRGDEERRERLGRRVIDMGAGLERLAWITSGTPTAYDCCFGPVSARLAELAGAPAPGGELAGYWAEAARAGEGAGTAERGARAEAAGLGADALARAEAAYMVADHTRTLVFAISDGALPSNVGGGYNLRMMLRRVVGAAERLGMRLDLDELVDMHIDYLRGTYPELEEGRADAKEILGIERRRHGESRSRVERIVSKLRGPPDAAGLVTLYESDGITPERLVEEGVMPEVPASFYSRLADLHEAGKRGARGTGGEAPPGLGGLPDTELLFYGSDPASFEATVLRAVGPERGAGAGAGIVLDRTSFYARGGGQEPDRGAIGGARVADVTKHGGVVLHRLEAGGRPPAEGERVRCEVDRDRRLAVSRNHTSTHVLNASARRVLGSWVWQHSAFKDADHARLDITHHSPLSAEQVREIEGAANEAVRADLPVEARTYARGEAERAHGFRIYQGGVVPVGRVRIVTVGDLDAEACGGTHVPSTGRIGSISITRTKRIQDGVVRLEFESGPWAGAAAAAARGEAARRSAAEEEAAAGRAGRRAAEREGDREKIPEILGMVAAVPAGSRADVLGILVDASGPSPACFTDDARYGENFHVEFGKRLVRVDPGASYCGMFESGTSVMVVVRVGEKAAGDAAAVAREAAAVLGGSGGGTRAFARGGGRDARRAAEAARAARRALFGEGAP